MYIVLCNMYIVQYTRILYIYSHNRESWGIAREFNLNSSLRIIYYNYYYL